MQIAKDKLMKQQKENSFKQQINEVKALLVDKEFDEAKKRLSAMQKEFTGHSAEMKILFKQIFEEETAIDFLKNKSEENFFDSSMKEKKRSTNINKRKILNGDFFGSDQLENKNRKSKVTKDDFDF